MDTYVPYAFLFIGFLTILLVVIGVVVDNDVYVNESFSNKETFTKIAQDTSTFQVWGWAINQSREKMEKLGKYFLRTSRHYGIQPYLIGIGWKYANWSDPVKNKSGKNAGKGLQRFYVLDEALRNVKDDTILLVMDIADTMINGTAEDIVRRFRNMNTKLLFSGEKNFIYQHDKYKDKYDKQAGVYKYLAAGTFIGYAKEIKKMVKDCMFMCCEDDSERNSLLYKKTVEMGIMGAWAYRYLDDPRKVQVDHSANLFWVTTSDCNTSFKKALQKEGKDFYNEETQTIPIILHLVQGCRDNMDSIYKKIMSGHS